MSTMHSLRMLCFERNEKIMDLERHIEHLENVIKIAKMKWRELKDAPLETWVLLAWGSYASGPMGHAIASRINGIWRDQNDDRVETDGFIAFAWMPLPDLLNIQITNNQ